MAPTILWTPPKLVQWISEDFNKKSLPAPHRLEAERLVCLALGITRLDIYLQHDKPVNDSELKKLHLFLKRRYNREPFSYIAQSVEFWGLEFQVGPGVLTPRKETEVLIEQVLDLIPQNKESSQLTVLELGTGSGVIPLSLCHELKNLMIVTLEKKQRALDYALENFRNHQCLLTENNNSIQPVLGDRFLCLKEQPYFDLLISNPPYIEKSEIGQLDPEVKDWEPESALDGGVDGLDFYHSLRDAAVCYLQPGGFLVFEHGFDQKKSLLDLMKEEEQLVFTAARKDYSNNDRVLAFQKKQS